LSFYAVVSTDESGPYAYDFMSAYISGPGGVNPVTIVELSDLTPTPSWTQFSGAISTANAGRNMEIGFYAENDDLYHTLFLIDSAALTVTACPP
jgi:hypothetical protein